MKERVCITKINYILRYEISKYYPVLYLDSIL